MIFRLTEELFRLTEALFRLTEALFRLTGVTFRHFAISCFKHAPQKGCKMALPPPCCDWNLVKRSGSATDSYDDDDDDDDD